MSFASFLGNPGRKILHWFEANLYGWEPLHGAAWRGDIDRVEKLLKEEENLDRKDRSGNTAMALAVQNNHREVLELLLAAGANPSLKNEEGLTTLHHAAVEGHQDLIPVLLEHRCRVNVQESGGWTPLHYAAQKGHRGVVELLLQEGAAVNKTDNRGETPLHRAASGGDLRTVQLLVDEGAELECKSSVRDFFESKRSLRRQELEAELMQGTGYTPLHTAAIRGSEEVVEFLLRQGVNPNERSRWNKWTPLHLASREAHEGVIKLLLAGGAEIEPEDRSGRTPLDVATIWGDRKVILYLIQELERQDS